MDTAGPFLVLAHHRSGSNFLHDLLQSHPCIECVNEPLSMHTTYFRRCDLSIWTGEDFDPQLLHRSLAAYPALQTYLVDLRRYLMQSSRMRVFGFKETVLFGKLGWLKSFLPSLRVIFLKRDPRSIVSSVLRSDLIGLWNYSRVVPSAFKALWPGYASRVGGDDPATASAELAAMSVAVRYELAKRTLGEFEHVIVQLEDMWERPQELLREMSVLLGIDVHRGPIAFIEDRQGTSRGGMFSSFRRRDDVEHAWRRDLSVRQVSVVEEVLRCAES